jgi:hypothetical protein
VAGKEPTEKTEEPVVNI